MSNFKDYHFKDYLYQALKDINFKIPTDIQTKVIPTIQHGKDVIGKSATGSGKTHAFLLPILDKLNDTKPYVQVIITTPSRELSYQIYENAKQLIKFSDKPIKIANYVGGTDKERQKDKLQNEQPQIVIGTPGRILDLVNDGNLDIHTAEELVIDEADMTLDLGFLPDVDKIAGRLSDHLQMMVFSATIPNKLQPFLKKYMSNPVLDDVPVESVISKNVDNWLISTKGKDKNDLIYQLLTIGNPYLVLIFANTKKRVSEISQYLTERGLKVAEIHGGIEPRVRKRVMKQIQNLDYQFVVASDLAARGIDIKGVSHLINDDIPSDQEYFIHRVGRTGRNNLNGIAITLYEPGEEDQILSLEKMKIKFKPKEIKNGEIIDSYDRNRRQQRNQPKSSLDGSTLGTINKKKKNVKPGYKKKIQRTIKRKEEEQRRVKIQQDIRAKKKQKKKSSQRYR